MTIKSMADTLPQTRGIIWMIASGLAFVVVTGLVRWLGTDLPAIQAAFIRYLFGLMMILPFVWHLVRSRISHSFTAHFSETPANESAAKSPQRAMLYLLRGLVHAAAVGCWFYAMARLPVALVTAIGFLTPISVTIAASLFLGETLKLRRLLGVLVSFIGAMIILAPAFGEFNLVIIVQLLAAQCFAVSYLLAKVLASRASSEEIVAMLTLYCTLALMPLAFVVWQPPNWQELILLALTAIFATFGHYALSEAIRHAPLTLLQPFTFLQLIWATIMGMLFFSEEPTVNIFLGSVLIVASTTYIAHRENTLKNSTSRSRSAQN